MSAKKKKETSAVNEKVSEKSEKKELKKPKEVKVNFESWYHSKNIPAHHYKEIVWADFKARGLTDYELKADYDKALKLYGLNV